MITFDDVVEVLQEHEDICDFLEGASEEKIISAEKYLGVKFPESYKHFLKKYGECTIDCFEIYGITKDGDFVNGGIPNGIWLTMEERKAIDLPEELVIVYDTGMEFFFCLDMSEMKDGECPVVSISDCGGGEKEIVYDSFPEFLMEECIKPALEYDDDDEE